MNSDALIPRVAIIAEVREDTPDVKTFRVLTPEGEKLFDHIPGQCAMLSVPGIGEAMISITSSPTQLYYTEFSVKKCGALTSWLHDAEPGEQITVRGPYGNGFPVETELKGNDLLFIAGGIGIAPLHSVINYCRAKKESYGKIQIVYGARTMHDFVGYKEIVRDWQDDEGVDVRLTIDAPQEGWRGHVGFIPNYVEEINPPPSGAALVCGPPVMIKLTLAALKRLGFSERQIYTTLEMRMKCGIGKCGRCNIGLKYVCKDGPVFRLDELAALPDEY